MSSRHGGRQKASVPRNCAAAQPCKQADLEDLTPPCPPTLTPLDIHKAAFSRGAPAAAGRCARANLPAPTACQQSEAGRGWPWPAVAGRGWPWLAAVRPAGAQTGPLASWGQKCSPATGRPATSAGPVPSQVAA